MFVDVHGRKVFSFGWWGTRGRLGNGRCDATANGDIRGDGGEVGSHRFAEFLSCIPLSLAPWEKKKSIISKNTLFFNWPFREKRAGGEGLIW